MNLWNTLYFGAPQAFLSWLPTDGPSSRPFVDLGYAKYVGQTLEHAGVNQWFGVRFAAPPLGERRWRAPVDPLYTNRVQFATQPAATCIGSFNGNDVTDDLNEDCLFLNIFTPANVTVASKLPVWFFIPGGGYAIDSDPNFNATEVIVKSNHSMIFVQTSYRVGAFGFLAGKKIQEDGDLNVGLLDQRKALQWVQKYIHLFGGDPSHVVIHGDSAGAGSVAYQLTAYNGRNDNLFVGAVAESPFWPTHRTVSEMEFQFERFAEHVNCPTAAKADTMACLRSQDTKTLQSADFSSTFPAATGMPLWYFVPVIDGNFSSDLLYNLFDAGKVVRVPLLIGDDTDEGTGFAFNASTSLEFLDFLRNNFPDLSSSALQQINHTYPASSFPNFAQHGSYFGASAAAYGEATFTCPGLAMASSLARFNAPSAVWSYRYDVKDDVYTSRGLGVPHVSERPAIFGPGNSGPCLGDPCSYETYNAPIVPVMMSYWISFVTTLDPNTFRSPEAPLWASWRGSGERLKIETNDSAMETISSDQLGRCAIWKGLAATAEQ